MAMCYITHFTDFYTSLIHYFVTTKMNCYMLSWGRADQDREAQRSLKVHDYKTKVHC